MTLDVLRSLFEIELKRADRFSSRAAGAFALALGFFALSQTIAFGSFQSQFISDHERRVTLVFAAIAAIAVVACGVLVLMADRAFKAATLGADDILDVYNTEDDPQRVVERLATKYAAVLVHMRNSNTSRLAWVRAAQYTALTSLILVLVELGYSLYARTQ